ncbi:hypothetical protein CATMIT_01833, partial [Catenibacterium mitsuokai DSM 15897]
VVLVVAFGAEHSRFSVPLLVEAVAALHRQRGVAVAVAVGRIGEAAGAARRRLAAASVDAVGVFVRGVDRIPAALALARDAGGGAVGRVAADADAEARRERALRAAGEDLDHAADGFRAVQAGERAAHDLHPFDLLDRNVLQRSAAAGGRAELDPVHQHQHVVGLGAA